MLSIKFNNLIKFAGKSRILIKLLIIIKNTKI